MNSARQYREQLEQREALLDQRAARLTAQANILGIAGPWGAFLGATGLESALVRTLRVHGHLLDAAGRERLRDLLR
jgi:hypothetical protein